jgi:hypothetical protein
MSLRLACVGLIVAGIIGLQAGDAASIAIAASASGVVRIDFSNHGESRGEAGRGAENRGHLERPVAFRGLVP